MISKQDLKDHEFINIVEYYDYIIKSEINGQKRQVRNLILNLGKNQKQDFLYYLEEVEDSESVTNVRNLTIELI